jgi:4-hydroxy-tetrahydrodipicolinate synthase
MNNYLWTAMITPFTNGAVDTESLTKLLQGQNAAGNGVVLLGSTGEGLNLDLDDKKIILQLAASLKLSIPIMVAIEGAKINDCLAFIKYVETLPFHSYLMVTPLYAKPGRFGQFAWFKTLMDKVSRPVMLYNIPSRTGTSLNLDTLRLLSGHNNMWSIKEASGHDESFKEYAAIIPNIYSGDDGKLNDFIPLGAKGVVSVASNVWPKECNLYVKLSLENKISKKEEKLWKQSTDALFICSNPIPVKSLLYITGRIKSSEFRLPLDAQDLPSVKPLETANLLITSWYQKRSHPDNLSK